MRLQSELVGMISFTLVFQSNVVKPCGSAVVFFPKAKSSIRIPNALARKALEHDARWKSVLYESQLVYTARRDTAAY